MRYRLMASYLGASYQAAVGPSDRDVTLFAAPPPPEEHGFSPVPGGGIWRKQVRLDDLDGLWESRPIGSYHGEPCLVLDDLGDRLHVVYLGMDERRAGQLGYWQVDRGVFEVVVQRHEVTDLAEERHEFPIALLLSALPRALDAGAGAGNAGAHGRAGSGARAGAGLGNGGNAIGRIALPSGGQGASAADGGISTWNGQSAIGTRQLPAAQPQQVSPGMQPAAGQQLQPAGVASMHQSPQQSPQSHQQSMQPGLAGGQQQMTGGYQSQPGMAPNGIGAPGAAPAASPMMQQPSSAQLPGPQQPGTLPQGTLPPGSQQTQAALPPLGDATSSLSSGASQGSSTSPQFLGGIESPPAGARRPAGLRGPAGLHGAAGDRRAAVRRCRDTRRPADAGHAAAGGRPAAGGHAAASQRAAARRRGRVARLAGAGWQRHLVLPAERRPAERALAERGHAGRPDGERPGS